MDWVWNSPFYNPYAYFLLNSSYNAGETSLHIPNNYSHSGIPRTQFEHGQPHINPYNTFAVKAEPKEETKDDMHVVKESQLGFDMKFNNIYNSNIKSEFNTEVTQIKKEKVSETHINDKNIHDMHIVKDKINVHQKESNIYNYKVKLEEFETEELVVNENNSNTKQSSFTCIEKNSDNHEYNPVLCKKEYSLSQVKQNLNNHYLAHEKNNIFLNKAEIPNSQESKSKSNSSINSRPNKTPMTCMMTGAISLLANFDRISKNAHNEEPKITEKILDREPNLAEKGQTLEATLIKDENYKTDIQNTILQNEKETTDADITNKRKYVHYIENGTEKEVKNTGTVIQEDTNNHRDINIETIFLANNNNLKWDCTLCDEKFSKRHNLKQHMLVHAESDVFTCSVCDYKTLRSNRLKVHMRMHTGERPFNCSECDFASTQQGNLKNHILRYHIQELKCSECKMLFKGKINLNKHKESAHSSKKRYACNLCNYRTNDSSALRCHAVRHSGIKKYICSDCNQGFRDKYGLKIHMLVHSGGKLLNCSECRYSTLEQKNLERHVNMVHCTQNATVFISVEDKSICEDCGYACKSKLLFDKHMQIHALHGKLLNCPKCAYKCKKYSTLREHSLLHKEKVLRCKSCNYRFLSQEFYDAHMIT
ncbi:unnamed protein product, partial [Meganyctiphanes norvegica]